MRFSHPAAWVALLALTILVAVALGVVIIVRNVRQRARRRGWPQERDARSTWRRTEARVEKAIRVTEAGDVSLALLLDAEPRDYRSTSGSRRLRRIVRVDPALADVVTEAPTLPVLVHPKNGLLLALDFEALLGGSEDAERLGREDYALHGAPKWTAL